MRYRRPNDRVGIYKMSGGIVQKPDASINITDPVAADYIIDDIVVVHTDGRCRVNTSDSIAFNDVITISRNLPNRINSDEIRRNVKNPIAKNSIAPRRTSKVDAIKPRTVPGCW